MGFDIIKGIGTMADKIYDNKEKIAIGAAVVAAAGLVVAGKKAIKKVPAKYHSNLDKVEGLPEPSEFVKAMDGRIIKKSVEKEEQVFGGRTVSRVAQVKYHDYRFRASVGAAVMDRAPTFSIPGKPIATYVNNAKDGYRRDKEKIALMRQDVPFGDPNAKNRLERFGLPGSIVDIYAERLKEYYETTYKKRRPKDSFDDMMIYVFYDPDYDPQAREDVLNITVQILNDAYKEKGFETFVYSPADEYAYMGNQPPKGVEPEITADGRLINWNGNIPLGFQHFLFVFDNEGTVLNGHVIVRAVGSIYSPAFVVKFKKTYDLNEIKKEMEEKGITTISPFQYAILKAMKNGDMIFIPVSYLGSMGDEMYVKTAYEVAGVLISNTFGEKELERELNKLERMKEEGVPEKKIEQERQRLIARVKKEFFKEWGENIYAEREWNNKFGVIVDMLIRPRNDPMRLAAEMLYSQMTMPTNVDFHAIPFSSPYDYTVDMTQFIAFQVLPHKYIAKYVDDHEAVFIYKNGAIVYDKDKGMLHVYLGSAQKQGDSIKFIPTMRFSFIVRDNLKSHPSIRVNADSDNPSETEYKIAYQQEVVLNGFVKYLTEFGIPNHYYIYHDIGVSLDYYSDELGKDLSMMPWVPLALKTEYQKVGDQVVWQFETDDKQLKDVSSINNDIADMQPVATLVGNYFRAGRAQKRFLDMTSSDAQRIIDSPLIGNVYPIKRNGFIVVNYEDPAKDDMDYAYYGFEANVGLNSNERKRVLWALKHLKNWDIPPELTGEEEPEDIPGGQEWIPPFEQEMDEYIAEKMREQKQNHMSRTTPQNPFMVSMNYPSS